MPDSGRSHTYWGNYNLSAVGRGYSCSSTDSQQEACLVGLPRGAGGSFQYPHSVGTVHDPESGVVTGADPSQVWAASGASHDQERYPWADHTVGVPPTGSHNPCCSGGGCSHVGKELSVGGKKQAHRSPVQ